MIERTLLIYSLLLRASFAFSPSLSSNSKQKTASINFNCGSLYARAERRGPMIVVGNTNEALAAAMALCTRDNLANNSMNDVENRRSPIPPAQLVAFFEKERARDADQPRQRLSSETVSSLQNALLFLGPSMDDYEQILASALQLTTRISQDGDYGKPMLYTGIEFGSEAGSKAIKSIDIIQNRYSFLGLNLITALRPDDDDDGRFAMSRESADEWGNKLQFILNGDGKLSAAVTMDVRTHLALLQANSLPRSRGALGEKDTWAIRDTIQDGMHDDNGDGMLLEYEYNYGDPFGGCDPLLCPSTGYIIPSQSSASCSDESGSKANDAYAAAYAAMVGLGMGPLLSICIATGVKAVFRKLGNMNDDGTFTPPSYTWTVIDQITDYSLNARQNIRQEDGLPRKMYKEFGYR